MALNEKRYLLSNITVKAPRINPQTGKDERTAIERGGHAISYRDAQDRVMLIQPNSTPHIVSDLNEGILRMHHEGLMGVKEVKDFSEILAMRQAAGERTERRGVKKPQTPAFREEAKPAGRRQARAVEMGQDSSRQRQEADASESQGAVNPDGEPNFVVRAPSAETRRKSERRQARS